MRATLKSLLRACRLDLKKNLNKREKWVKEWPGQVITRNNKILCNISGRQMLITSSQIQWTSDCEKALGRGDKKGLKSLKKKQVLYNGFL